MIIKKALRRIILSLLAVFLTLSLCCFLIHLTPGDPVDFMLGGQSSTLEKSQLRQSLGLDKSLLFQYKTFLLKLMKGDIGLSLHSRKPVLKEILEALPMTFQLAVLALFLTVLVSLPLGLLSAVKKDRWPDLFLSFYSMSAVSVPVIISAPILIWFFAVKLSLLPVSGVGAGPAALILPALSLAFPLSAVLLKMSRQAFLEVITQDYVRTAWAKGLSFKQVHFKHIFRNALTPILTVVGLQMGALLTGTVIVESIFDWPGLGLLLLESIYRRDYPLVQGSVMFIAVIYILVNLCVDLAYLWVQPKMRT